MKNTCGGVHLLNLPAKILQACNFTKNELLQTYLSRILARFMLLFIVFQNSNNICLSKHLLLVLVKTHALVYSISYKNAFHSYCSFLLILTLFIQNNHRLTECFSFLSQKTDFLQKYVIKTTTWISAIFFQCCFMSETQVLMSLQLFFFSLGIISWKGASLFNGGWKGERAESIDVLIFVLWQCFNR